MKTKAAQWFGAALFGIVLLLPGAVYASTAANTTITNEATVSFSDNDGNAQTPVTASVAFEVNLVPSAPLVDAPAPIDPASESTTYNLLFTLTGTANGPDTYNVVPSTVADTNMTGAPTFGGDTSIVLGGTTLADAVAAGATTITVPFDGSDDGSVNGIVAGDTIVLDPTGGTPETVVVASVDESTGPGTNVVTITLADPLANGFPAAIIIGEQGTATVTVTTAAVDTGNTGSHEIDIDFESDTDGTVVGSETGFILTVRRAVLSVSKFVRNVTTPNGTGTTQAWDGETYYASGVSANPGETMEYLLVVANDEPDAAPATNIVIADPIPLFTSYVGGSIRLQPTDAAATIVTPADGGNDGDAAEFDSTDNGTVYIYAGVGGEDNTTSPDADGTGTGGDLSSGETSFAVFRVTID